MESHNKKVAEMPTLPIRHPPAAAAASVAAAVGGDGDRQRIAAPSRKNTANNNVTTTNKTVLSIRLTEDPSTLHQSLVIHNVHGNNAVIKMVRPDTEPSRVGLLPGDVISYPGSNGQIPIPYDMFTALLSSSARPVSFDVVRTVIPIRIEGKGPVGMDVCKVKTNGGYQRSTTGTNTGIEFVQDNSQAAAAGIHRHDIVCYPGTKGLIKIPHDMFVHGGLAKTRPLVFDVWRVDPTLLGAEAVSAAAAPPLRATISKATPRASADDRPPDAPTTTAATRTSTANSAASAHRLPDAPTTTAATRTATANSAKAPVTAPRTDEEEDAKMPALTNTTNKATASRIRNTVKSEACTSTAATSSAASARGNTQGSVEVIEILSDSSNEDDNGAVSTSTAVTSSSSARGSSTSSTSGNSIRIRHLPPPPAAAPARTGTATHVQPRAMVFPPVIDTLFDGNASYLPQAARGVGHYYDVWDPVSRRMTRQKYGGKLTEIQQVKHEANTVAELKFIWPMTTPVPESTGGFFETVVPRSQSVGTSRPAKKAKTKGTGKKTHSRIARLAGTITVPVDVATKEVYAVLSNKEERTFFLAEDLITAEKKGRVRNCIPQDSMAVLNAIAALNDKDNPFRERCLYVIAESVGLSHLPAANDTPKFVDVTFYVYFRRALFGLSANPMIKVVLDALKPLPRSRQRPWTGCRKVPEATGEFRRSPRPGSSNDSTDRFDHSLPGLLWANESMGYPAPSSSNATPAYQGAKVTLRDYQKQTVAWMRGQEDLSGSTGGGVPGLNGYFWERRSFADNSGDDSYYYYFPLGGHVLLHPPPLISGGLNSEEMGLGKTVEIIELICSDAASRLRNDGVQTARGGTLVVLPVSLLAQWTEEMQTKAPHLSLEIYYSEKAKAYKGSQGANELSKYDVVLTTMSKLQELTRRGQRTTAAGRNVLGKVSWHRLVVDECQFLKNDTTAIARAASAITTRHIWMLSGTPLTNKLDDLRGELSLLRVWPFTHGTSSDVGWNDYFWSRYIKDSWDSQDMGCLQIVTCLMRAVSIRHSRLQTRADGSPLVDLPPRTERYVAVRQPPLSSDTYVSRWLEATAVNLLQRMGRVDVRILGQILQLRQVATSGALLSLDRVDEAQRLLTTEDFGGQGPGDQFRQLTLRAAGLEYKRKAHPNSTVLSELIELASPTHNVSSLPPCSYCLGPRSHPAYLPCDHSLCVKCCRSLLQSDGHMACPTCKSNVAAGGIIEVLIPKSWSCAQALPQPNAAGRAVAFDLTNKEEDQIDKLLHMTEEAPGPSSTSNPMEVDSIVSVSYLDGDVDFQKNTQVAHTLESLKEFPDALSSVPAWMRAEYPNLPESLAKHVIGCQNRQAPSPKIEALVTEMRKIRSENIEAKICVFSSFSGALNEVEDALNSVTFDLWLEISGKTKLEIGQKVVHLSSGREGYVHSYTSNYYTLDSVWGVQLLGDRGRVTSLSRRELAIQPACIKNVPSMLVRKDNRDLKLSVNGSNDRFETSALVQSRRPPSVSSENLLVGYNVEIHVVTNGHSEVLDGRIERVHPRTSTDGVRYDVKPTGVRPLITRLPASQIEDLGSDEYRSAVIQKINSTYMDNDEGSIEDPYSGAIGYVRLDGSAGDAAKRGDKINIFRNDPMTSVFLMTKTAAGVGLNLTDANHAIILEPSMDAHDEVQSICRIHRIGQTRPVQVLRYFVEGGIEERILKRRQQRGELTVSINATAGAACDSEEDGDESSKQSKQVDATVSASRSMAFSDLRLLLGK